MAKRNHIVGKLKSKYWVLTHKFGVNIPKSVQKANVFDEENGHKLWWDSLYKETKSISLVFEVWRKEISELPPRYQNITCHMIFDVKMGKNFRRKARFDADGHKTKTPEVMAYSLVVSRDSVWIAMAISVLNELDVLVCDIHNAYLMEDFRERVWVVARPKFGSEARENMLTRKELYGLKSSSAAFRDFLVQILY